MAKRVAVSFKDREGQLYDYLMEKGKLSPSIYLKRLLQEDMARDKYAKQTLEAMIKERRDSNGIYKE